MRFVNVIMVMALATALARGQGMNAPKSQKPSPLPTILPPPVVLPPALPPIPPPAASIVPASVAAKEKGNGKVVVYTREAANAKDAGSAKENPRPNVLPVVPGALADQPLGKSVGLPGDSETKPVESFHIDLVECPQCCSFFCELPARWTVRHDIGDGVGYTRGFTFLEGFVPLYQPGEHAVLFGNGRVVNFDDLDRWEFNAGAGYRAKPEALDAVLGVNVFYDGRHADSHFFHQIGVGGEALFPWWEMRCNGYIVVGDHQKLAAESFANGIVGNQLFFQRAQVFDVAMGGLDVEVGALLPVLPQVSPRAFIGYYHYSAEGMQSANGVRGRFEAWLCDNCSLHFAIQNDAVFDTTVSGGVALHFGGSPVRREAGPRSLEERLGQRVVRDVDIVIAQKVDVQRLQFKITDDLPPFPVSGGINSEKTTPPAGGSGSGPPPPSGGSGTPPSCEPPPSCWRPVCLPFPGAPGNPKTFPGHKFPPGFHHACFPGRGRYKHLDYSWHPCWPLVRFRDGDDD